MCPKQRCVLCDIILILSSKGTSFRKFNNSNAKRIDVKFSMLMNQLNRNDISWRTTLELKIFEEIKNN